MTRGPRPAERRAQPRLCAEPGCPRQPENHYAVCSRHAREYLHDAFRDDERVARLVGAVA